MTRPGTEVERGRRLAEVWRASAPSNEEIERLRERIAARPARRRRSRLKALIVALVQGFMLGGATLATAAWLAGRAVPLLDQRTEQAGVEVETKTVGARHAKRLPRPAATDDAVAGEVPHAAFAEVAGETAAASEGAATEATRSGPAPSVVAPLRGRPAREQERRESREPATAPAKSEPAAPDEETEPAHMAPDGPWGRVARALSAGDWQRADAALISLASAADPATRDAADLARAELWIAHGRGGAFRANVERLASAGYTPLIRKRAAKLLERIP